MTAWLLAALKVTVKSSVVEPVRGAMTVVLLMLSVGAMSSIVPVPVRVRIVALVGVLKLTLIVSGTLLAVSPWMTTGICSVVWPAANVIVPVVAV